MADTINTTDIEADIKKFVEIYCTTGAHIASEEFEKRAKLAIQAFYKDYPPSWYHRTGNMEHSFKKYYHNNSNIVYGGVRIGTEDMKAYRWQYKYVTLPNGGIVGPRVFKVPGKYYPYGQNNPSSIVEGVWEHGARVTARSSPSPLRILKKLTIQNHQLITSIKKRAMQAACSAGYSVIQPYMN